MAPHSSPPSSAKSLCRQPTISSFFSQKAPPSPQTATSPAESGFFTGKTSKKRPASPTESNNRLVYEFKQKEPIQDEEEQDEDVVVRPTKRTRINRSHVDEHEPAHPSADIQLHSPSQPTTSQRTDLSKFQSSQVPVLANDDTDTPIDAQQNTEREKLHEKFVRKLGGSDCLIGIGRNTPTDAANATAETEEGDEEEESAAASATKKGLAKRGGGKLTPMEKQVIEIKRKHLDTVMAIQVGYKFHFYGEDARIAAKELNIVCIPGKMRFDERT